MGRIGRAVGLVVGLVLGAIIMQGCGGEGRTVTAEEIPTDGLIGWYDASRGLKVDQKGRVVRWRDRSAAGRDLKAQSIESRPTRQWSTLHRPPGVKFDGVDDVLRVRGARQQTETLHVVLVVAPRDNAGKFDGLLSAGAPGQDDSQTGFNIDLGGRTWGNCEPHYPEGLEGFNTLNVESSVSAGGCGRDMYRGARPFGIPSIVVVEIAEATASIRLGGRKQHTYPISQPDRAMRLDNLRVGARYYDGRLRGFFRGVVTEILVYDRDLTSSGRKLLVAYLREKYGLERPVVTPNTGPAASTP